MELADGSVDLGSSDAAVFTHWGVRAAALCAMDPHPADYYHNRRDDPANMDRDCIAKTCEILLDAVQWYDKYGIGGPPPAGGREASAESETSATDAVRSAD
jgi:hypothetical protein